MYCIVLHQYRGEGGEKSIAFGFQGARERRDEVVRRLVLFFFFFSFLGFEATPRGEASRKREGLNPLNENKKKKGERKKEGERFRQRW